MALKPHVLKMTVKDICIEVHPYRTHYMTNKSDTNEPQVGHKIHEHIAKTPILRATIKIDQAH